MKEAVSIITPTGDREEALRLLAGYIRRQTYSGRIQWIVVDDGEIPFSPDPGQAEPAAAADFEFVYHRRNEPDVPGESLNRNLITALRLARHGKILVMEDDDWYHPQYVETLARWLDVLELAGEGQARYYNVRLRKFRQLNNRDRASLCQTGWRRTLNPQIDRCCRTGDPFIDLRIWRLRVKKFVSPPRGLCVGIKGMPGRRGYGIGHRPPPGFSDDGSGAQLRRWIGSDSAQYLAYYERPIPSWWDWIGRQPRETRWCVIGKGPSFAAAGRSPGILDGRRTIGLNHICRALPVDVTHIIDLEVIEELGETLWDRGGVVVMPWHPHRSSGPRAGTLAECAERMPLLERLRSAGRLLHYHLDMPDHNRFQTRPPDEPAVGCRHFSSEAACNLLVGANVREIALLGIDGGGEYAEAFGDLPVLRNGRQSFDVQFRELDHIAKLHQARIVPLATRDGRAHSGAADGPPLAFVHLPKAAGTSIRNALDSLSLRPHWFYGPDTIAAAVWPDVVGGHLRASALVRKYPGCRLITCVRHPVDRLISHWRFWHAKIERLAALGRPFSDPHHARFARERPSLEEFAGWEPARVAQQLDVPLDRFDGILRYDRLRDDWPAMLRKFELPPVSLPCQNVTPPGVAPPEFDRDRVEAALAEELAFYDRISAWLETSGSLR